MNRNLIRYAALAAAVVLGACSEKQLVVQNQNQGDTKRVLGTPQDAENLIGTYFKRWHSGVYGSTTDIEGMANVMSVMNYSSLANNCQNSHYPFVGSTNFNSPGNTCQGEQFRLYSYMSEVNRVASNLLNLMADSGLTIGNTTPATDAQNLRAKSFSEFLRGISLGYLALVHDSAAITSPSMGKDAADCVPDPFTSVCVGALRGYKEVFDSAMVAFQRSLDYANTTGTTGTNGLANPGLPTTWIPSPTVFTTPEFVKLIRTYRARIRANVARTPAERAAVDWSAVIADAQNGITTDHILTMSTTAGPANAWRQQYDAFSTWHQMPAFVIGMADTSGAYAAWIAQAVGERGAGKTPFFMVTPDIRFPQGGTRAAQQTDFAASSCAGATQTCKRYFVNRAAGSDNFDGNGWGWSNYDFVRFHSWVLKGDGTARNGNTLSFAKAELDLLQAEGLYRQGNFAAAGALVNKTRTAAGGLPAITVFDATTPVPGGARACVPKVPVAPFNVVACGNLWEALKYEKRIETAYTAFTPWYLDMRGWGDLPADTPLFWAVPFQELQARGRSIASLYGAGIGTGNAPGSTAAKGTYGW
ncbi:MAG: hypothetical protein ABJF01_17075 [bacterium]